MPPFARFSSVSIRNGSDFHVMPMGREAAKGALLLLEDELRRPLEDTVGCLAPLVVVNRRDGLEDRCELDRWHVDAAAMVDDVEPKVGRVVVAAPVPEDAKLERGRRSGLVKGVVP